ncbi:glycosyl transferase [Candidatus Collierbacteria bacterium RIFCSPHIGHO2_02_FULL_49_10]|uniref:Glycosyl transferase n=1 Tax=Candidatus Collierbacteria bacterium RIFCSPHIGHO2_02_FULL_49_10 TaxID=1817723 RepID=A0A1F5ER27_9BACT|nr:MAG: glycosyl transferase [Candidatus Collierbacteria bacterium RIFCSPHIGHO2_02_FULL_49_10]
MKKLTIIMPVFNEEATVLSSIRRVLATKIKGVKKNLVVINDGSTDRTKKELARINGKQVLVFSHRHNLGKGAAIRTALENTTGDIYVIQDADLEYDPNDINLLISPILTGKADVVFGSRFVGSEPHRVLYFWHRVANQLITFLADCITNLNLTDIETGYKAFSKKVADSLNIQENRFGFEPEFTIKVAKNNFRVYEVGVSYAGRSYEEGKKIGWRDGIYAIWTIIKYSFS